MVNFISPEQNGRLQKYQIFNESELIKDFSVNFSEDIDDVGKSAFAYIQKRYGKTLGVLKLLYGVWVVFVIILAATILRRSFFNEPRSFLFAIIFPGIVYVIFIGYIRGIVQHLFFEQFADANNYSYLRSGTVDGLLGALFSVGHDRKITDIIIGSYGLLPLIIFNYEYTIGHGRSSHTHEMTVFKIDFKASVPLMLFVADQTSFGDNLSDNNLKHVSKVELPQEVEGKFNLFVERKFEIEALQIFTPNVLAYMIDHFQGLSFDFSGQSLYVYAQKILTTKSDIQRAYELVQYLINKLRIEISRTHGSVEAMSQYIRKE